jgi:hypothetical protein
MRTTLSLDEDVLERARAAATRLKMPFKTVVNEALRAGLREVEKPPKRRPYRTVPIAMGLRPGFSYDNIQELLSQAEGEDCR